MRALASVAPERLRELNIEFLISQNRCFRSILVPQLPQILSINEILALRTVFENSSPFGITSYLRVLEKKSFWTFVDEGLSVLVSNPDTALHESIVSPILKKVALLGFLWSHSKFTTVE